MLSLLGGVPGILAGVRASLAGATLLKMPFFFNPRIAFLFSGAVGVIFGYFPARKAAQINPLDALPHE
jgi:putative ABC transport system permease protein